MPSPPFLALSRVHKSGHTACIYLLFANSSQTELPKVKLEWSQTSGVELRVKSNFLKNCKLTKKNHRQEKNGGKNFQVKFELKKLFNFCGNF